MFLERMGDRLKVLDRGARNKHSRKVEKQSEIEGLIEPVVSVSESWPIIDVARIMYQHRIRRIPIVTGDERIIGEVKGMDMLNFLGAEGLKIITEECEGNILKAINLPISKLMSKNPVTLDFYADFDELISTLKKEKVGSVFVTKDDKLVGRIRERAVIRLAAEIPLELPVEAIMTEDVVVAYRNHTIKDVARIMVKNGFRRLPVLESDRLIGIVTYMDIIEYLGSGRILESLDYLDENIEKIMTTEVDTIGPLNSVQEFCQRVIEKRHGGFPVYSDELEGIVTERDVIEKVVVCEQ